MSLRTWTTHALELLGCIAFLLGVLDPLEGSPVILGGSVLLVASLWVGGAERAKKMYWTGVCAAISFGVFWMFVMTMAGGIGGTSRHSVWWGVLLLPYPLGWIAGLVGIAREVKEWKREHATIS